MRRVIAVASSAAWPTVALLCAYVSLAGAQTPAGANAARADAAKVAHAGPADAATAPRRLAIADRTWNGDVDAMPGRPTIRVVAPLSRSLH